ncbi:hypothetical protein LMF89_11510 [Pelosinus sp. Bkl1]|uniref:Uncharacterized protein n=1 Tax=Pelosinus baikalensis TaxID=2892015 RepID=A0ABS8HVK8_9FIRM|nr:hypothetical protein [Pelosinus baikalensis]
MDKIIRIEKIQDNYPVAVKWVGANQILIGVYPLSHIAGSLDNCQLPSPSMGFRGIYYIGSF